jgi:hypothetical protein
MTDPSEAIIAEVERGLKSLFEKALVIGASENEAATYEAKAASTTDPQLAKGYRKLAKRARKAKQ